MTALTPQLTSLVAVAGVSLLMTLAGVQKNTLEWKRRRRKCPACGRHLVTRRCGCSSTAR